MRPIIVFALHGALGSSLALPLEMLHAALQHRRARDRHFEPPVITVAAAERGAVSMSGSLRLMPDTVVSKVQEAELAIIPSLWRTPQLTVSRHPAITDCIRRLAASGTRICAVGTGSYFPAAAGLLDGRAATTHWSFFDDFFRRYPAVQLQRRHLITRSGNFYCAGSVNSVADLMVHFIRELLGAEAARQVEGQFSPEIRRPFEAHSFVEGEAGAHPDESVWIAQDWMLAHLGEPLRMPELAARCGLSTRSLNRRFRAALGTTPLAFLQQTRVAAARELLRASNLSAAEIAARCGFGSASNFSRSFLAQAGSTPQDYRRRVRGKLFSGATENRPRD